MRPNLILAFLLAFVAGAPAANLDSLWAEWQDARRPDSLRLQALDTYGWEGYGYSQPDSAYYFAQLLYDYAAEKNLPRWKARALKLQGNTFVIRSNYLEAYNRFQRSLAISEQIGDRQGLAGTLHSIGIIHYYQGNYPRAIEYYTRSLKIREELGDKAGIAGSVNNIGIVYSHQGNHAKAIEFFRRSMQLSEELGDRRTVASACNNIGLIYNDQGLLDSAFACFSRSLSLSESLGDRRDVSAALNNLATVHESRGEYDLAFATLSRSLAIERQIGDQQGVALSHAGIGSLFLKQGKYRQAIDWCKQSLTLAEQIGVLQEQKQACECIYESYKALGRGLEALAYHERLISLEDSLHAEATSERLQQMEFARQVLADSVARAEEQRKMEAAHRAEIRRKNRSRNLLIGVAAVLLLGAGTLFSQVRIVRRSRADIAREKERSEYLLLNILPAEVARELKDKGEATARRFDGVSVLFTDFQDFTEKAAGMNPEALVAEVNECFKAFDDICLRYGIEKIKTIGDAYMAAGGIPVNTPDSTKRTVLAALEMAAYMQSRKAKRAPEGKVTFAMRAGIHTGPVVAGIVGVRKFQYDFWGDTVNLASRMERHSEAGKVNISCDTYDLIKDDPDFVFEPRGMISVKGKGHIEMHFVRLSDG